MQSHLLVTRILLWWSAFSFVGGGGRCVVVVTCFVVVVVYGVALRLVRLRVQTSLGLLELLKCFSGVPVRGCVPSTRGECARTWAWPSEGVPARPVVNTPARVRARSKSRMLVPW